MGFEVKYTFHPRKQEGGYDTELKEEKLVKVGKPFDDTPMEKVAAAIMAQLARRDVWVVDVEIFELVRKPVSFKECKDGKGITLKGRRYSFNEAAQLISEETPDEVCDVPQDKYPHELIAAQKQSVPMDALYQPNKLVPVQKTNIANNINQNKVIYKVVFDPPIQYINEVKRLALKFSADKEYNVHQVIQHPTGKLELQKIAVTDDMGRVVTVDEKFFTIVGTGLFGDKQLNFSGSTGMPTSRKPKLMFEDQMVMDTTDPKNVSSNNSNIPLDDGTIPEQLLAIPDIRAGQKRSIR